MQACTSSERVGHIIRRVTAAVLPLPLPRVAIVRKALPAAGVTPGRSPPTRIVPSACDVSRTHVWPDAAAARSLHSLNKTFAFFCLPQATPNKPRGCTAGAYTCGCMRGGARGKKGAPCAPPLPPWLPPPSSVTSPALCDHGIALIQKNVTLLFCSPYHVLAAGGAAAATELRVDPPREGAPQLCVTTWWHASMSCMPPPGMQLTLAI